MAKSDPELAGDLDRLRGKGVRFMVCRNTLNGMGLRPKELYGVQGSNIVTSGVAELARLQGLGLRLVSSATGTPIFRDHPSMGTESPVSMDWSRRTSPPVSRKIGRHHRPERQLHHVARDEFSRATADQSRMAVSIQSRLA